MFLLIELNSVFSGFLAHNSLGSSVFKAVRHELVAHRPHYGVDVVEAGVAFRRKRLLQSLSSHADFGGHIRDAFDPSDNA